MPSPGEVEGSNWTSILYHWPWAGCFERKSGIPRQKTKKGHGCLGHDPDHSW